MIVSYVKDSVIIGNADTHSALKHKINTNVQHFSNTCSGHQMQISAQKSASMLFGSNTLSKGRPLLKHMTNVSE